MLLIKTTGLKNCIIICKYSSTIAILVELGRLLVSNKAWAVVMKYGLRLKNEKFLMEHMHMLWYIEIIFTGYKVCNICSVQEQEDLRMCGWIHHTTIIGAFMRYLLKDLTINILKLYINVWPHQLNSNHCVNLKMMLTWLPLSLV